MKNLWPLLKIQLLGFFGINKTLHSKDFNEKKKGYTFLALRILLLLFICAISFIYSFSLSFAFEPLHVLEAVPAIMMYVSSLVILFTTIYKVNDVLFAYKDYDIIMALPIETGIIIASRILVLYLMNVFFTIIIMVPATIVYGMKATPPITYYVYSIISIIFLPFIPIILATLIGSIITIISSRFRHTNIISIILSILALSGFMVFSMQATNVSGSQMEIIFTDIIDMMSKAYPPLGLYIGGTCEGKLLSLLQFIGISGIGSVLYILVISKFYKNIHTSLTAHGSNKKFTLKRIKQSSGLSALYHKELKRYFSSSLYVINTSVGVILLLLFSAALYFLQPADLDQLLEMPGFSNILQTMAPVVSSFFIVLACTTSCSISLEGKSIWIVKSLPISAKDIFLSKVMVNLTITVPAIFINAILQIIGLRLTLATGLLTIAMPLAFSLFMALCGLVINLHFPVLDWMNEVTAIKQGASILLTMLSGFLCILLPFGVVFSMPASYSTLCIFVITLLILLCSFLLYRYLIKSGTKRLCTLGE